MQKGQASFFIALIAVLAFARPLAAAVPTDVAGPPPLPVEIAQAVTAAAPSSWYGWYGSASGVLGFFGGGQWTTHTGNGDEVISGDLVMDARSGARLGLAFVLSRHFHLGGYASLNAGHQVMHDYETSEEPSPGARKESRSLDWSVGAAIKAGGRLGKKKRAFFGIATDLGLLFYHAALDLEEAMFQTGVSLFPRICLDVLMRDAKPLRLGFNAAFGLVWSAFVRGQVRDDVSEMRTDWWWAYPALELGIDFGA